MDLTTLHTRITALRSEDTELSSRLDALETDLADWMQIVAEAQLVPPEVLLPPDARGSVRTALTTERPANVAAVLPAQVETPGDLPVGAESVEPDPADDEERLLEGVDADTANAIRVKRRLLKNRKSVRELLDEVRASRPAGSDSEGKSGKSWWRR